MPFRYRKSINLGGGVRLNVNKKSLGLSAGTKHARFTANTSGRTTTSFRAPGTGLSWQQTGNINGPQTPHPGNNRVILVPVRRRGLIRSLCRLMAAMVTVTARLTVRVYNFYSHPEFEVREYRKLRTSQGLIGFCALGVVTELSQTLYAGAFFYLGGAALSALWLVRLRRRATLRDNVDISARADRDNATWLEASDPEPPVTG